MKKEPKYVAETLAWCNKRRKEQGKRPLKKMPKGITGDPDSCPCGRAANVSVFVTSWGPINEIWYLADKPLSKCVQRFVDAFDNGKLPQYIK